MLVYIKRNIKVVTNYTLKNYSSNNIGEDNSSNKDNSNSNSNSNSKDNSKDNYKNRES